MSFTPEEEQRIAQLVPQFSLSENLPESGVAVRINAPQLTLTFPSQPSSVVAISGFAQAGTRDEAISVIDGQVDAALGNAMAAIDAWIASLGNHHRDFELYREAYRRAKARF